MQGLRLTAERRWNARPRPAARAEDRKRRRLRGLTLPRHRHRDARPMAFDPRMIDDLARRLAGAVPESVIALRRDLEQNFKGVLQSQLARLDLVTREEFDVQAAVLKRTREKLAALEQRLAALEGGREVARQPISRGATSTAMKIPIRTRNTPNARRSVACGRRRPRRLPGVAA